MTRHEWCTGLALIAAVGPTLVAPASAIAGDEFLLRSGADVVALCGTPAGDPLYTAAIRMCHGFGAGDRGHRDGRAGY